MVFIAVSSVGDILHTSSVLSYSHFSLYFPEYMAYSYKNCFMSTILSAV